MVCNISKKKFYSYVISDDFISFVVVLPVPYVGEINLPQ